MGHHLNETFKTFQLDLSKVNQVIGGQTVTWQHIESQYDSKTRKIVYYHYTTTLNTKTNKKTTCFIISDSATL